jgi:HK97 family phage portal protein
VPKRVPRYLRPPRSPERRSIAGEELWWPAPGSAGVVVTEDTALRLPALLATITGLAQDVATLPRNVYQRQADGGRRGAPEHAAEPLLTLSPDGETTPIAWWAALMGHSLQRGNGYAEIQRRGNGKPTAMHLLDPRTTRPERIAGSLRYMLGNGRSLPPEDVLHVAGFGPDGLCGYNFIKLTNEGIGVGLASQSYAADFYANGADPGGVIEHPQKMTAEALNNFRDGWNLKHRGPGNRHTPAILQQGAKWNQTGVNPEQSQLVETRKFQANDSARPWRMPPHKYGDFSQAHLANIEASNLDYLQTALMWWVEIIEQQCNLKLISRTEWGQGYYIEHNVLALLRGDITSRFNAYAVALNNGWMNRDEVRKRENLNPIGESAGGTKYLVQSQYTTLEAAGKAPPAAPAPPPARQVRFNPNHGADGQFSSGTGGGGGPHKVGKEEMTEADLEGVKRDAEAMGASIGQEWEVSWGTPANKSETKLSEKAQKRDRALVRTTIDPKTVETKEGDVTRHTVGGGLAAETKPNPDGAGWISRQHRTFGGGPPHDDVPHPSEAKALAASRKYAERTANELRGDPDYETPRKLRAFFEDERDSPRKGGRFGDPTTSAASYTIRHHILLPPESPS